MQWRDQSGNGNHVTGDADVVHPPPTTFVAIAESHAPMRWWQSAMCWAAIGLFRLARLDTRYVTVKWDNVKRRGWNEPADGEREP